MLTYKDLWDIGPKTEDRLRTASPSEARRVAVALCAAVEHDSCVDDEMLMFAGKALGAAGHAGVDENVAAWRAELNSDRRTEIVGSLLWGYWMRAPSRPSEAALNDLLTVLSEQPLGSPAWSVAAVALATAANHSALAANIRDMLRARVREARDRLAASSLRPTLVTMLSELIPV